MLAAIMVSATLIGVIVAIALFYTEIASTSDLTRIVELAEGQGEVVGSLQQTLWTNEHYYQFLSIPYAESPKGDLRFKAPVQRKPWTHIHNGTYFGLSCPVITTVSKMTPQEINNVDLEDCLNLCVYTKSFFRRQPVMFYIHGGGFYNGSASDYTADHLLAEYNNIVLVVIQYRVGALGWLTTYTPDMPGNAPVADIVLALKWVQTHIHKFGGDYQRVTIVGQSAGAVMAGALLLSPETANEKLFHSAIIQSGSILSSWAINKKPLSQAQRICRALKCKNCVTKENLQTCLRSANVIDILKVTTTDKESFSPVLGDLLNILPRPPNILLDEFDRSIPIMTGFTKHDGSFVLAKFYDTVIAKYGKASRLTVRQFAEQLIASLTDNGLNNNLMLRLLFDSLHDILDTREHKQALPAYFDIANIAAFKSDTIDFVKSLTLKKLARVYLYSFDYAGADTRFGYEFGNAWYPFDGGIHHSNENIYLFSKYHLNEADTKISKKMVALWTSFIIKGAPKGLTGDASISAMSSGVGPYFHINGSITIGMDALKLLTATIDDPENYKLIRPNVQF